MSLLAPHSDVLEDQQELQKRLEDFKNGIISVKLLGHSLPKGVARKQCLRRTSENSCFQGSGACASGVYSTERMVIPCAKKFHDEETERVFLKEASILAHLQQPSIVIFLCCYNGQERGVGFLAMELFKMSLSDLTKDQKSVYFSSTDVLMLQQELDILDKLRYHWIVQNTAGLSVGSKEQDSNVIMDLMSVDLGQFIVSQIQRRSKECDTAPINIREAVEILLQITEAVKYMPSIKEKIHRDLKASKVLGPSMVSDYVADFDLSLSDLHGDYKGVIRTRFWRAPEILQRLKTADCSKKLPNLKGADVFSFGMTCWEVLTGRFPFSHTPRFFGSFGMGSIGKTTLSKSLFNEKGEVLKHLCDEDFKEDGYVKKEESAIINGGSGSEAIVTCQNSTKFVNFVSLEGLIHAEINEHRRQTDYDKVNVDTKLKGEPAAAQAMDDEAQPSKALNSPSFLQQHGTEILSAPQMPESVFGVELTILNESGPAKKRIRTRNWSAEEIRAVLELTEEALRLDVGPDWDYVSENLWELYDFDRASNSCENLWGTLLQSYRAIRDHEFQNRASTEFDLECREKIERIITAMRFEGTRSIQMDSGLPSSPLPLCQFQSSASDVGHFGSTDCDDVLYEELTDSEIEEIDIQSEEEGLSGDSTATLEFQAEVTADSQFTRTKQSHEPCYETNSKYASRKRYAATVDEDDLISKIAPFVNKQIEDALKPLISVLRSREEDEQKHRDKMLAIEEEKLALKREKMLFTYSVLANSNSLRASLPQVHHQLKFGKGSF